MTALHTEIRARELRDGDLFREFGDDCWEEAVEITHGDDMRIETHNGGARTLDGDSPIEAIRSVDVRRDLLDVSALDTIAALMSGTEWSADTFEDIARAVRSTGREINDPFREYGDD